MIHEWHLSTQIYRIELYSNQDCRREYAERSTTLTCFRVSLQIVLGFLRPRVEDVKAAVFIGGQLQIISRVRNLRVRNEFLTDVGFCAAFLRKMPLPEGLHMRPLLDEVPRRRRPAPFFSRVQNG